VLTILCFRAEFARVLHGERRTTGHPELKLETRRVPSRATIFEPRLSGSKLGTNVAMSNKLIVFFAVVYKTCEPLAWSIWLVHSFIQRVLLLGGLDWSTNHA